MNAEIKAGIEKAEAELLKLKKPLVALQLEYDALRERERPITDAMHAIELKIDIVKPRVRELEEFLAKIR